MSGQAGETGDIDVPFVLTRKDFLTGGETDELDRLRHAAKFYGGNMQQRSLDRLNWLEVAYQRDVLWGAYQALRERLSAAEAEVKHWKDHAQEAGAGFAQICRDAAGYTARNRTLVEGILRLADSIHGDSGWEHNGGCEGESDCLACIEADLRQMVSPPGDEARHEL